jgi:hypothetical protein
MFLTAQPFVPHCVYNGKPGEPNGERCIART